MSYNIARALQTKMGTPEAYLHNEPGVDCSSPQVLQASWPRLPNDGASCQVDFLLPLYRHII